MIQININRDAPKTIRRTFAIGDEWLYYKFYTGAKTADLILVRMIKPLTEDLLIEELIDKWFYIRYSDPQLHIRVRFHVLNQDAIFNIIQRIRDQAAYYIENDLIWKIQTDTYQREVERYGPDTVEYFETLFFYDSQMMVHLLGSIEGDDGERMRWLFGLRALDSLLNDFLYSMKDKAELMSKLRERTGREFLMSRVFKMQLENKFRLERSSINAVMDVSNDSKNPILPLLSAIEQKSRMSRAVAKNIIEILNPTGTSREQLDGQIPNFSHMMLNRLFRTKGQLHEMVLYDFLSRYYRSEIARNESAKKTHKQ